MQKRKIFISSVQKEFKEERAALRDFITSEPLFWAHYIERAGTGTLDMISLCRKAGIPEPKFEQRDGQFVLIIRRPKMAGRPVYSTSTVQVDGKP
ncbi:MAG: hypothetical protein WC527_07170, partial [Candidatus Margulisiibacteriota bacterium]